MIFFCKCFKFLHCYQYGLVQDSDAESVATLGSLTKSATFCFTFTVTTLFPLFIYLFIIICFINFIIYGYMFDR